MKAVNIYTFYLGIIFFMVLGLPEQAEAQKFLQIEKYNSAKTVKFAIGEMLFYKTKVDGWNKSQILDIDVENGFIELNSGIYTLDEIISLRSGSQMALIYSPTLLFLGYGIPALTYTTLGGLVYGFGNPFGFITGGAALGIAAITYFGGKVIFQYRHKRYRYRLIDISFGP